MFPRSNRIKTNIGQEGKRTGSGAGQLVQNGHGIFLAHDIVTWRETGAVRCRMTRRERSASDKQETPPDGKAGLRTNSETAVGGEIRKPPCSPRQHMERFVVSANGAAVP